MLTIEPHLRKSLFMKLRETWMCSFFVAREPTCQHSGWDLGWEKMTGVILLPSRKSLLQKMPCLKYRRLHVRNSTQKMPNATRGETFKQEIFLFSSIKIHEEKHEKLQFSIWYITAPSSLLLLLNTFSLPDEPNFPSQNTKLTRIWNKRNRTKPQKTSQ